MFFFFQAEDGIRDDLVTGVQTCALPIFTSWFSEKGIVLGSVCGDAVQPGRVDRQLGAWRWHPITAGRPLGSRQRSEERRVGKECRARWATECYNARDKMPQ